MALFMIPSMILYPSWLPTCFKLRFGRAASYMAFYLISFFIAFPIYTPVCFPIAKLHRVLRLICFA